MFDIRDSAIAVRVSQIDASEVERNVYALDWTKPTVRSSFMPKVFNNSGKVILCRHSISVQ